MLERLRAHIGLVAFVAFYYLGFLTLGWVTGNGQVWYYAVFLAVLFGVVVLQDSRRHFSDLVLWGLAIWGALHMAGGLIPVTEGRVLYNVWMLPFLRFDHLVHIIGFGFAGLGFWESVQDAFDRTKVSGAAMVMIGGLGFGAVNEMVEFIITRLVPDTNIGGFENAGWDLVANTIGAALAALSVRWEWSRRRSRPLPP